MERGWSVKGLLNSSLRYISYWVQLVCGEKCDIETQKLVAWTQFTSWGESFYPMFIFRLRASTVDITPNLTCVSAAHEEVREKPATIIHFFTFQSNKNIFIHSFSFLCICAFCSFLSQSQLFDFPLSPNSSQLLFQRLFQSPRGKDTDKRINLSSTSLELLNSAWRPPLKIETIDAGEAYSVHVKFISPVHCTEGCWFLKPDEFGGWEKVKPKHQQHEQVGCNPKPC